jgi:hypothetical protein
LKEIIFVGSDYAVVFHSAHRHFAVFRLGEQQSETSHIMSVRVPEVFKSVLFTAPSCGRDGFSDPIHDDEVIAEGRGLFFPQPPAIVSFIVHGPPNKFYLLNISRDRLLSLSDAIFSNTVGDGGPPSVSWESLGAQDASIHAHPFSTNTGAEYIPHRDTRFLTAMQLGRRTLCLHAADRSSLRIARVLSGAWITPLTAIHPLTSVDVVHPKPPTDSVILPMPFVVSKASVTLDECSWTSNETIRCEWSDDAFIIMSQAVRLPPVRNRLLCTYHGHRAFSIEI